MPCHVHSPHGATPVLSGAGACSAPEGWCWTAGGNRSGQQGGDRRRPPHAARLVVPLASAPPTEAFQHGQVATLDEHNEAGTMVKSLDLRCDVSEHDSGPGGGGPRRVALDLEGREERG